MNSSKGLLITFEGGEGAGKTTLMESIVKELKAQGKEVLKTREPGGTQLGEQIRSLLLHQTNPVSPYAELGLFLASRAQHIAEVIRPALLDGKIVLCDRFNDSSIVYQGVGRGLGVDQVRAFCHFMSQGVIPDLTLYLDVSPEKGLARLQGTREQDRIESETLDFHQKIRRAYLAIQKTDPNRFCTLNAEAPPVVVFQEAMKRIHSFFLRHV